MDVVIYTILCHYIFRTITFLVAQFQFSHNQLKHEGFFSSYHQICSVWGENIDVYHSSGYHEISILHFKCHDRYLVPYLQNTTLNSSCANSQKSITKGQFCMTQEVIRASVDHCGNFCSSVHIDIGPGTGLRIWHCLVIWLEELLYI